MGDRAQLRGLNARAADMATAGRHVGRYPFVEGGVGDKIGPILVQLPSQARNNPGRLDAALAAFPAGVRVAVEFRHP